MQDLRIKPVPLEVEAQSPSFWTARKFLGVFIIPILQIRKLRPREAESYPLPMVTIFMAELEAEAKIWVSSLVVDSAVF
jgi:hypothetical protein